MRIISIRRSTKYYTSHQFVHSFHIGKYFGILELLSLVNAMNPRSDRQFAVSFAFSDLSV